MLPVPNLTALGNSLFVVRVYWRCARNSTDAVRLIEVATTSLHFSLHRHENLKSPNTVQEGAQ